MLFDFKFGDIAPLHCNQIFSTREFIYISNKSCSKTSYYYLLTQLDSTTSPTDDIPPSDDDYHDLLWTNNNNKNNQHVDGQITNPTGSSSSFIWYLLPSMNDRADEVSNLLMELGAVSATIQPMVDLEPDASFHRTGTFAHLSVASTQIQFSIITATATTEAAQQLVDSVCDIFEIEEEEEETMTARGSITKTQLEAKIIMTGDEISYANHHFNDQQQQHPELKNQRHDHHQRPP